MHNLQLILPFLFIRNIRTLQTLSVESRQKLNSFRVIQLILKLHRITTASFILPSIVFAGVMASVLIQVVFVKLVAGNVEMPLIVQIVTGECFVVFSVIVMVILGQYGKVQKVSFESQMCLSKTKQSREIRAFLASLPIQRIYFGSNNFLEPATCLNLEKFISEQTASLLLVLE